VNLHVGNLKRSLREIKFSDSEGNEISLHAIEKLNYKEQMKFFEFASELKNQEGKQADELDTVKRKTEIVFAMLRIIYPDFDPENFENWGFEDFDSLLLESQALIYAKPVDPALKKKESRRKSGS